MEQKPYREVLICTSVLALLLGVGFVARAEDHNPGAPGNALDKAAQCEAMYNSCGIYALRNGAAVYVRPDIRGRVVARLKHGEGLGTLEPASKLDKVEWVPVGIAIEGPKGPYTRVITAYVRRSDVILDTDFRKVVGCWPVKYALVAEEAAGDFEPHGVWFSTSGLVRGPDGRDFGEQHTYYAEGVFTVRHPKYANLHLYGHGTVDYERRIAKYMGTVVLKENESVPGVEWFTPADLKGCKAIPTIDPDSHAPNPKE
jgi:hypothetical protein